MGRRCRTVPGCSGAGGFTLLEAVAAAGLLAVAAMVILPGLPGMLARARLTGAARQLGLAAGAARMRALTTGRTTALRLEPLATGDLAWTPVVDGDGDGLRLADLADGIDSVGGPRRLLSSQWPGILCRIPAGGLPLPPPGRGRLEAGGDPVRFGSSHLLSFSPEGGARAGSLYLSGRAGAAAVVVAGATGRIRVLILLPPYTHWKEIS